MGSQYIANGIVSGALISVMGLGFWLVYHTSRTLHFAQAAVFLGGAYVVLAMRLIEMPFFFSILLAICFAVAFGLIIELAIYAPLRRDGANYLLLFIASLGIYIVFQNIISLFFSDDPRSFRFWSIGSGYEILGARLTTVQAISVVCAALSYLGTWGLMRFTLVGRQIKAVANDRELAQVVGINVRRSYLWAMVLGSMLTAISGILTACDVDMKPTMGMQPLMMGVVAVLIGGNTLWGTACGGILLGMAQHLGVIWLPTKWQEAIAFVILLFFLLFRPQGFLGRKVKKATL